MKIYVLSLGDGRYVFYSEEPETAAEAEAPEPRRGMRGWAERRYKSLQVILNESEKGVGLRIRRIWESLQKRISPDEPVLRSLRRARTIVLHHPDSFTEAETRTLWRDYLKNRKGRHTFWFVINLLVSPLTLVLAPLPGPNIIGYWFVYRAVCHLLARLGAANARSAQVTTKFLSTAALDGSFGSGNDERIADVSLNFELRGLDEFVKRMTAKTPSSRRKAPVAVS
nr:mitochondrial K+-H+ exchange-related protein [uncultured bacterium]